MNNTDGESYISIGTGDRNRSLLLHANPGGYGVSGGVGDKVYSDFATEDLIKLSQGESLQGMWVNYITTVDATTLKLYKNGVFVKSASLSPDIIYNSLTDHWFTGMHSWDGGNQWSQRLIGSFDDFTVWNRALSDSEAIECYNLLKK